MDIFTDEIENQEEKNRLTGQESVMAVVGKFKDQLYRYTRISPYQTAFLRLLDEKWETEIYPLIEEHVVNEFNNHYGEPDPDRQIVLQGIRIPEKGSQEWELNVEDETVDPIVHVYMKGWAFDYTALTG